ncbi:MAG: flagellar hook basal-body protein [Sedimentisphaerales bacterium]|nr:flagellar hook basal-body protein [Sedimentisphaerales bacterium]
MSDTISNVCSTLGGLKQEFNTIAHNLANIETVGYKRTCNAFSRTLAAQGVGSQAEVGEGVNIESELDFTQGSIIETGQPLDFGLAGKGFFVVETPAGALYTRNGMFRLNQNGQIVDTSGRIVAGESGPISIPPSVGLSQISVSGDGSIAAGGAAVGKFRLVDFGKNEKDLRQAGSNCFEAPAEIKPEAATNVTVKQGFKESSNVQMMEELVDMMMVARLYEANMRFISAKGDASRSLIDLAMS